MNIYYFKTTAAQPAYDSLSAMKTVEAQYTVKGATKLIESVKNQKFTTENWSDFKAIERTILNIAKQAEMVLLTTESSYYGKKYIGVMY